MTTRRSTPSGAQSPWLPRFGRWRPPFLLLVAAAALLLLAALGVERGLGRAARRAPPETAARAEEARRRMVQVIEHLRWARESSGVVRDEGLLPEDSPLLGAEMGPLVTTLGSLEAKRIAASPEWARVLTIRLDRAGIRGGDFVAASFSGSFPGLNLALVAACQALGADLAAVSSVTASCWGANQPGFTWPEIEARLVREGLIRRASAAVSAGGMGDRALDLEPESRALARRIAATAARDLGADLMEFPTMEEAAAARISLYLRLAGNRPVSLYVNIGGGEVSMGRSASVLRFRSGFLPDRPFDLSSGRGVMARFVEKGVPVLSLLNIRDLALAWGLTTRTQ